MAETLYITDLSPFGARLRLVGAFTGFAPQEEAPPGGAGSDPMKEISVFGKMPAIALDDTVLIESLPLMEYCVDRAGGSPLVPDDPAARARMRGIMLAFDHYVLGAIWPMFLELRSGKPDPAIVKPALAAATEQGQELVRLFEDKGFVLGEEVSLADLAIAPFALLFGKVYPVFGETSPFESVPRLKSWWERTNALPEVSGVMEKMDAAFDRVFGGA
jgi:glutathione S-transferase